MNIFEIELRYEVTNISQLAQFLTQAMQLSKKRDIDVYLDTSDYTLWQRGIFIRIRNDKTLDIKFNRACLRDASIDRLDYCEEHRFSLPLEESKREELNLLLVSLDLKQIPSADLTLLKVVNSLQPHYVVDKVRTTYSLHEFTLAFDEVADLGTFLEIELMAENADALEQIRGRMLQLLDGLGLRKLRMGYGTELLRKNDFDCYRKGRYALAEDRSL
jgi:predicted adenylyl cyclase CyaB